MDVEKLFSLFRASVGRLLHPHLQEVLQPPPSPQPGRPTVVRPLQHLLLRQLKVTWVDHPDGPSKWTIQVDDLDG